MLSLLRVSLSLISRAVNSQTDNAKVDNKCRENRHNTNKMTELPQARGLTLQVALCDLRPIPTAGLWQACSSNKGNVGLPNVCRRSTAMQAQLLSSSARRPLTHGCSLPARPVRLSAHSSAPDTHSPVFSRHVKDNPLSEASKLDFKLTVDFGAGFSLASSQAYVLHCSSGKNHMQGQSTLDLFRRRRSAALKHVFSPAAALDVYSGAMQTLQAAATAETPAAELPPQNQGWPVSTR